MFSTFPALDLTPKFAFESGEAKSCFAVRFEHLKEQHSQERWDVCQSLRLVKCSAEYELVSRLLAPMTGSLRHARFCIVREGAQLGYGTERYRNPQGFIPWQSTPDNPQGREEDR